MRGMDAYMENKFIENILKELNNTYYAHTKTSGSKELLVSHLKLTYKYYEKMEKEKKLDILIKNIIKDTFNIDNNVTEDIYILFKQAIYYHDIGKINPLFQKNKMNNDLKIETENTDDTHAALSARIYIDSVIEMVMKEKTRLNREELFIKLYSGYFFGYIISRHHTKLETLSNLLDSIKNKKIPQISDPQSNVYEMQLNQNNIEKVLESLKVKEINMYILCKLLYSCIITADFYATYDYMSGKEIKFEIEKQDKLFEKYENSDLIKNIRKYAKEEIKLEEINKLRSDMFLETESNLKNNLEKNIFYLEAPTGAGKTNMAINLARVLYKTNKDITSIHYIFPFNNIIEQTDKTFQKYFNKYEDYVVINSVSAMTSDKNENLDYEEVYTKNIFNQYPIIITSHINLFNTLFGTGKEKNYSLYNYINSVVILDEIQAYSNNIWREMIEMFDSYAKLLNIKFIIMSATLPRLDRLLDEKISNFVTLINDTERYYKNDLFGKRVNLNYDLLNTKIDIQTLTEEILKHQGKKILIECIKKDTAEELYKNLKEKIDNVYIMTGDDNKYSRQNIIEKTKKDMSIVLVATQTIEAGVDIDMDIGFKDISFIDSEEQFLGRINRSNKKKDCIAYFFNLDDANAIYRKDKRLQYNLNKEISREWIKNKKFELFYNKILQQIKEETEEYTEKNISNFKKYCKLINYKKIEDIMQLIKTNTIDIFINYTINIKGKEIKGSDIFNKYIKIYKDNQISYSEKKVKLSQIAEELNLFIYSINPNKINLIEGELIGGMYYVDDGEKYIVDGRFDRSKYLEKGDELFL